MKKSLKHPKSIFKRIFKKHKLLLRSIAVTLVLTLLFTSLPMEGFIALAEQIKEDSKLVTVVEELEEYRTEFSKTYLKSDGTLEAVVSSNPIHFNDDGEWEEIDSTLQIARNDDGKEVYQNKKGKFKVNLPTELESGSEVEIEKGDNKISIKLLENKKTKGKKNNDKKQKAEKLTKDQRKKMTAGELFEADNNQLSTLEYTEAYLDTNLRYDVTPNEVKESIILQKAPNKKATYSYEITADGLTAVLNEDNSIDFFEETKTKGADPVFSMPAPHMFDSNDVYSYDIETTLQNKNGKYILTYKPDYEWLKSKERAYPVTLDPTVTVNSGIQDSYTFSGEGYGDSYTGYEQQLKVGTTAWIAPNDYWQTYLKFTDLPQIPYEDYRIDSAYLMLTPKATTGGWQEMELGVYELTEDWKNHLTGKVAERITFNNAPEDVGYSTATASVARGSADNGVGVGFEIAHLVEKWYDSPETNFGIKLAAHLEASQWNDNLVFHSSRSQTGTAPYLSLTYTEYVPVTGIEIIGRPEDDIIHPYITETLKFSANVYPENATDKAFVWESSDQSVVETSPDGQHMWAIGEGETVITARSVSNPDVYDSFTLTLDFLPVEGIEIINKPNENKLLIGSKCDINIQTTPINSEFSGFANNQITFESYNSSVATIDSAGLIKAIGVGTTTIIAKLYLYDDLFVDFFELTVYDIPVERIEIIGRPENDIAHPYVTGKINFSANVYPENATNKEVIWESSDHSIVDVIDNTLWAGNKSGTVVITARSVSNPEVYDSFTLTVELLPVERIEIANPPQNNTLPVKSTYALSVTVIPENAAYYPLASSILKYSSSDTFCAEVSSNGIIHANHAGTTTITVEFADYIGSVHTASFVLTVEGVALDLTLPPNRKIKVGESWQLADHPATEISIADESILQSNEVGCITGISPGTTTLRIWAVDEADFKIMDITVYDTPTITINGNSENRKVELGDNWAMISYSTDATVDFEVEWTSSNEDVAVVEYNDLHAGMQIYPKSVGTTIITVRSVSPEIEASDSITLTVVHRAISSLEIIPQGNLEDQILYLGQQGTLKIRVSPADATAPFTLHQSNNILKTIETIQDTTFYITAEKVGTTNLWAASGDVTSNILNITVKAPKATIKNRPTNDTVYKNGTHTLSYESDPETGVTIRWYSSNSSIAKIDEQTGKIEAKSVGSVTISIKVKYGDYSEITDSFTLYISNANLFISGDGGDDKEILTVGETKQLTAEVVAGENASQEVEWISDTPSVATVDSNGLVTAHALGEVIISAKSKKYEYAIDAVYFEVDLPAPTSISLSETSGTLYSSEQKKLIPTVTPLNSSTNFVWESEDPNIAHVSDDGTITAKNIGDTKITVSSKRNPNVKAEYSLTVKNNVSYILYTQEWENDALKNKKDIADEFYNGDTGRVELHCLKTGVSFKNIWNNLNTYNGYEANIDYVIVDTHGSPDDLSCGIDITDIMDFNSQDIKTLIILGCKAGHIDKIDNNVASTFANITNSNPVIASDSNVIGIGEVHENSEPLVYKTQDFDEGESFDNRETFGWLVYQKKGNVKKCYSPAFYQKTPKRQMSLFRMIEYIESGEYLQWEN